MTLGWLPDHWGVQQLSIECSWAFEAALRGKLALLLPFVKSLKMETTTETRVSCFDLCHFHKKSNNSPTKPQKNFLRRLNLSTQPQEGA